MREWPLILFTLATQLACGLTVAATVFEASVRPADVDLVRPLAVAIFPVLAAGILVSTLHLKRPWTSWRALTNLSRSRLSLEALVTTLFAALALAYSELWWTGHVHGRLASGTATSVAGIAAVIAAARVYKMPTRPVWNSGWVATSFLGTAVLIGGLFPAVLIPWNGNRTVERAFLAAAVAGALMMLIAALWMMARCGGRRMAFWVPLHLLLVAILPCAAAVLLWSSARLESTAFGVPLLAGVFWGAAVGRARMYGLAAEYAPF